MTFRTVPALCPLGANGLGCPEKCLTLQNGECLESTGNFPMGNPVPDLDSGAIIAMIALSNSETRIDQPCFVYFSS